MAKMIPESPSPRTLGEKELLNFLERSLDDLWTIYYEPMIGGRQPDFILFHPYQGILVLEVKDYSRETIKEINPDFWEIKVDTKTISVKSPIKQVIAYRNALIDLLSMEKDLIETSGRHKGKPKSVTKHLYNGRKPLIR
ncbi:nuclease-related domain-containing protein [Anoxybacillus flavithermus]|uniref:NERD domain-containing protein n=1 Tax=Anoxybacillus flavithermus AK1 TaxID=1297581 RepID=M8DVP7_9BACL|nr:nuclease-related domain-containing protein [Anoxybacillus flavithermus]EMT44854.1 hypothetical protein H919_13240 [Anoxybacillus flavithermus AK1]